MKSLDTLEKYYDQFTPMERLNLYLKARIRKDYTESNKLIETCPLFQYIRRDLRFTHKFDRLISTALLFMLEFQGANSKLELSEFITMLLYEKIRTYEWMVELLEQDAPKQEIIAKTQNKIAELNQQTTTTKDIAHHKLTVLKTEIEAYRQFCNDAGLDADTVLSWCGKAVVLEQSLINDLNDVAPYDSDLVERKKQYEEAWNCDKNFP